MQMKIIFLRFFKNLFLKFLRFIRNVVTFLWKEWAIPVAALLVVHNILWILGWIGILIGIPAPVNNSLGPELGLGYIIIIIPMLVTIFVFIIYEFMFWLREIWKNS
jgi:hypothetical protein